MQGHLHGAKEELIEQRNLLAKPRVYCILPFFACASFAAALCLGEEKERDLRGKQNHAWQLTAAA